MLVYLGTNAKRLSSKIGAEGATVRRACWLANLTSNWKVNVYLHYKVFPSFFSCLKVVRKGGSKTHISPALSTARELAAMRASFSFFPSLKVSNQDKDSPTWKYGEYHAFLISLQRFS